MNATSQNPDACTHAEPREAADETCPVAVPGVGLDADYAAALLAALDVPFVRGVPSHEACSEHDVAGAWARSGAMMLSGLSDAEPLPAPAAVASCMQGAAQALSLLAARLATRMSPARPTVPPGIGTLDGAALLGERAALADPPLVRCGSISPGGGCRLLRCRDAWIALNLARAEDLALIPAWLETTPFVPATACGPGAGERGVASPAVWDAIGRAVRERPAAPAVDRARLLGLAAASTAAGPERRTPWCRVAERGPGRRLARRPLVLDLSALWAGPLTGQLLAACGARVIKVESLERPDGARRGSPAFFDLMNGEKESVALALGTRQGVRRLEALVSHADVVIESSRPRALAQLGIDAARCVATRRGLTWISITGYGRAAPAGNRVAFGDDAAVAGGLFLTADDGTPVFCGDAIADPLTGLHAAVAAVASLLQGGGRLLDVALAGVAARVARHARDATTARRSTDVGPAPAPPRARPCARAAAPLGAHTARVLEELGASC